MNLQELKAAIGQTKQQIIELKRQLQAKIEAFLQEINDPQ
jgi:hypothetical protein